MKPIFNYHTSRDIATHTKDCSIVQVMASGYRKPSTSTAKSFLDWPIKSQKFILHQDYYKTPTRFLFMSDDRKRQLVEETTYLLKHGESHNLYGIVFHMDTCFNKKFITSLYSCPSALSEVHLYSHILSCVQKNLSSRMYKTSEEIALFLLKSFQNSQSKKEFVSTVERESTLAFLNALSPALSKSNVKILLENTTKDCDGISLFSSHYSALKFLQSLPQNNVCLCHDEEHAFASGWDTIITNDKLNANFDYSRIGLVHLNTIPSQVTRGSKLDRHSETTIFEGQVKTEVYRNVVEKLNNLGIPHIREVDFSTFLREVEQCKLCK